MAAIEETPKSRESRTRHTPVELQTENGYSIVRSCEMDGAAPDNPGEYSFLVINHEGDERSVVVEFDTEARAIVQRCRKTPLAPDSSFWINCAEHSLAAFLWEKDEFPPDGKLTLKEVCLDDLDAARRCDES